MVRKRKAERHSNQERWLISYADFITLLFALFVVLFASSQTDKAKMSALQNSYLRAVRHGAVYEGRSVVARILGGTVDEKGIGNAMMRGPGGAKKDKDPQPPPIPAELLPPLNALNDKLAKEIAEGKLQVSLGARGLVISFRQTALFRSGDDQVQSDAAEVFRSISEVLRDLPNNVVVEGHTDSIPIHNSRFRSNWELSAARSIAVMDMLISKFGIDRRRVAILGYGENQANGDNQSEEGRAKNRRVDLVIQNLTTEAPDMTAAAAPTARP
ncbi:flagellar motor protein MotB [uncultured Paludibaculum sp.]|uniref:flagellar motor protein MotB n=1 Tax=uncultured Paludibaculum sp. TaxID=1765020 RepID=UPI002AAA646A|nr:flagellar motor protein MotB [uncultured Paludibaculum sp.]